MARKQKTAKPLIKAASIATAIDKLTGKVLGWSVKSNSSSQYYQVRSEVVGGTRVFFCDCDAHLWGYSECCHIKAVQEVLIAKAELIQAQGEEAVAEAEKIVAKPVVKERMGDTAFMAQMVTQHKEELHTKFEAKVANGRAAKQCNTQLTGRGFVVAPIAELGGRMVPLKVA
jgi:hypothetical protein